MNTTDERKTVTGIHIRWIIRRDLRDVLLIEKKSHDRPLGEEGLLGRLRQRRMIGMVAELGGHVVGYMLYEIVRQEDAYEVSRLAVHPAFRGLGVGSAMLGYLNNRATRSGEKVVRLLVPERNLSGQLWLRDKGVRCVGVDRGCDRPDSPVELGEDLFVFELRAGEEGS